VARQFAGDFWALQNPCKYRFLFYEAFPNLSQYLLGLLHATPPTHAPIVSSDCEMDHERICATGEAFIYVAMTRLMVMRLAHA
jgi:hypothetical protein